ncbi:thiol:disulfide interchange protein DsbG [Thiohalorhabdus sp.]|uniref:thiol:disulfide interchange protein DsbG n=1 Tax=Thiohalorhabdus sp. TaxID=3094134 RepID=UPI002FC381F5
MTRNRLLRPCLTTLALLVGLIGLPAGAPAASGDDPELPPAVQALTTKGLQVVERFEAPGGLTGFTARAGGREVVVYATPDGEHVLLGTLLDERGNNLTKKHLAEHMPSRGMGEAWARLEEAQWIATGAKDPERVVYMFTDPFCPYCHAIWKASRPYYEEGLQIRHVLVGVIRPNSKAKAAAMLQADDPAAAFRAHQQAYGDGGGKQVSGEASDPALATVEANNRLMRDLGIGGTPAVIYKNGDGEVKLANGMPKLSKLADIYRLPEKTVDDPSLDRFR